MMKTARVLNSTLMVIVAMFVAGYAGAQTDCTWINTGSGSWATPGNWNPTAPTSAEYADIANGGTARVDAAGAAAYGARIGKGAGSGSLVITPAGALDVTAGGGDILLAEDVGSVAELTVQGGSLTCDKLHARYGESTITVTGGLLTATSWIRLAGQGGHPYDYAGNVEMIISGGAVHTPFLSTSMENNTTSLVAISGGALSLSKQLYIGRCNGNCAGAYSEFTQSGGTLNAEEIWLGLTGNNAVNRLLSTGGRTTVNKFMIGYRDGQDNQATLGGTTEWTVGGVAIGDFPTCYGHLTITNDAVLDIPVGALVVGSGKLGSTATGVLTVAGGSVVVTGGVAYTTGHIQIGSECYGRMEVTGGSVLANEMRVGFSQTTNGYGELHVSGGNISTPAGRYMYIGYLSNRGRGAVVQTGGTVDVGHVKFGGYSGCTGTYTMVGGVLKAGTLRREATSTGTFDAQGGIFAVNEVDQSFGSFTNHGATISPAYTNYGVVKVESGDYVETSSDCVLDIQIGGKVQGTSYDWVDVNGTATLAGELQVSFGVYDPTNILPSDKFYVVEADADIEGAFANVASGGRVVTEGKHTFLVYYGSGVPGGYDSAQVTLTDFKPLPSGTMISVR